VRCEQGVTPRHRALVLGHNLDDAHQLLVERLGLGRELRAPVQQLRQARPRRRQCPRVLRDYLIAQRSRMLII
jgi:hypothetical protein